MICSGLAVVLFLAPFAIGAAHGWTSAALEICVWVLGLGWFVGRADAVESGVPRGFIWVAAALCLHLAFQMTPLPRGAISVLSPATADLYRQTVDTLAEIPASGGEIRSVGQVEDEKAAVAERGKIREFAGGREGWFPEAWRTLTIYPFATKADLLLYLSYGIALWLAATLPMPRFLLKSAATAAIAVAALALIQFATWNGHVLWFFDPYERGPFPADYPRMMGPFVNPDELAAFLAMTFPPAFSLLAVSWSRKTRRRPENGAVEPRLLGSAAFAVGLAVTVAALIGSASRGGFMGALLGTAVFAWGWGTKRRKERRESPRLAVRKRNRVEVAAELLRRFGPAALAIAILLGGLLYAGPRSRGVMDIRLAQAIFGSDIEGRVLYWAESLPILRDFPLFGVGAGSWREVFYRYEHYPMVGLRHNHAHGDYLEWCAEVGLVGVLLTAALAAAYARWARGNQSIPGLIRWGIVGGVVAIGWQELIDFNLRVPANAMMLAVLLGLLCNKRWEGSASFLTRHGRSNPLREETSRKEVAVESAMRAQRSVPVIVAAVGIFALLTAASARQFREFWQWAAVRGGSSVLRFAPGDADTWKDLGRLLHDGGFRYLPPTEECFRAAIRRRPSSGESFWAMSLGATERTARLRLLQAALYLEPTRAYWRLTYATLLDSSGRPDEALKEVGEAVYRDPRLSQHPYLNPGDKRNGAALLEAVERGFRRALDDRPDDPALLNEVASFYHRYGIFGEAAALWLRAAEHGNDRADYELLAGGSYARLANYERAEKIVRRAIVEAPERADGYRLLAMSVLRPQQKYEEAREVLERGIRSSDDAVPLYLSLHELEVERGNRKGALDALAKAADVAPRNIDAQIQLGEAYLAAEDYHRAQIAFDRAIRLDGKRAQLYYYEGTTRERLYDFGGARKAYQRALEIEPGNQSYVESAARMEKAFAEAGKESE